MTRKVWVSLLIILFCVSHVDAQNKLVPEVRTTAATTVMYHKILTDKATYPELVLNGVACRFSGEGLYVTGKENVIRLDRYYSLGERLIRYHVKFSEDAKAVFQSSTGDFKVFVDIPGKTVSFGTNPVIRKKMDFIHAETEYLVEIYRTYQQSKARITDIFTGMSDEIEINGDGEGGCGAGSVQQSSGIVHQWDHYCFGLQSGTSMLVKQISVLSQECDLTLLIIGDSQSQPEGYFPAKDFPESWTQLIMNHVRGKAISSGRGGCTIKEVQERIQNELPYVKAKYVMVTIGTNGGNTEENLSELVEYIISQGSIPILNNIPSNEHGTQVEINKQIEKIRQKYQINGCRFDLATSLNHDGQEVDKSTMWHEDYDFGQYYHHPNIKGSRLMFIRTLIDTPEIYE